MSQFIFVRHGQTEANAQGLMCGGKWDIELSPVGTEQALAASRLIEKNFAAIDKAFVSPMRRASTTAEHLLKNFSMAEWQFVPELREWEVGLWERKPFAQIQEQFLGDGEPEGGETRLQFRARVKAALDECLSSDGLKIIVSHGGVWLQIQNILGMPPQRVGNCIPHLCYLSETGWQAKVLE